VVAVSAGSAAKNITEENLATGRVDLG
jgi:hypothetical protein